MGSEKDQKSGETKSQLVLYTVHLECPIWPPVRPSRCDMQLQFIGPRDGGVNICARLQVHFPHSLALMAPGKV